LQKNYGFGFKIAIFVFLALSASTLKKLNAKRYKNFGAVG
jgi:hypothetical protein